MYLGAHVKASGGVWTAIENGTRLGAEAIQFFAGSPRTWKPQLYKEKDAARFREARAASAIRFVVIHTIYLINLATTNEDFYEKSVVSLVGAVTAAEQLGADAIVTHVGSHQGAGFAAGLERVREALKRALDEVGFDQGAHPAREHGRRRRHDGRELRSACRHHRRGRRRCARGPVSRHGTSVRGRPRPAHARGSRRDPRAARRHGRPRPPRHVAPERQQDSPRLQPRPAREHRRRRARQRGLREHRQPPGLRRPARHPRSAGPRRQRPRQSQRGAPRGAARRGRLASVAEV